jgi:uncharacterized protein (TIGR02246 family)
MTPLALTVQFVEKINAGDIQGVVDLMSEDHRFVDSLGNEVVGREKMREGWQAYFRMVPDYRVEVQETFVDGEVVVLIGIAQGTYTSDGTLRAENAWRTPAVWRVVVRDRRVAVWQVYSDNEPIRQRIAASSA